MVKWNTHQVTFLIYYSCLEIFFYLFFFVFYFIHNLGVTRIFFGLRIFGIYLKGQINPDLIFFDNMAYCHVTNNFKKFLHFKFKESISFFNLSKKKRKESNLPYLFIDNMNKMR